MSGNRPVWLDSVMLPPTRRRTWPSSASTARPPPPGPGRARPGSGRQRRRTEPQPVGGDRVEPARLRCSTRRPLVRSPGRARRGARPSAPARSTPRRTRGQLGGRGFVGIAQLTVGHRAGPHRVQRHLLHPRHVLVERVQHRGRRDRRRLVAGHHQHRLPDVAGVRGCGERGQRRVGEQQLAGDRLGRPGPAISPRSSPPRRSCSAASASTAVIVARRPSSRAAVGAEPLVATPLESSSSVVTPAATSRSAVDLVQHPSGWADQVGGTVGPAESERLCGSGRGVERRSSTSALSPVRSSATMSTPAYGVEVTRPALAQPANLFEPIRCHPGAGARPGGRGVVRVRPHVVAVGQVDGCLDHSRVHEPRDTRTQRLSPAPRRAARRSPSR